MKPSKLVLIPLALAVSMAGQLLAQADSNVKGGDTNKEPKTVSVSGCLAQSEDPATPKQYILKSGEMSYALEPGTENLNAHLGHKVTISGTSMKGKGPHDDERISVTKLTMVSTTCP